MPSLEFITEQVKERDRFPKQRERESDKVFSQRVRIVENRIKDLAMCNQTYDWMYEQRREYLKKNKGQTPTHLNWCFVDKLLQNKSEALRQSLGIVNAGVPEAFNSF